MIAAPLISVAAQLLASKDFIPYLIIFTSLFRLESEMDPKIYVYELCMNIGASSLQNTLLFDFHF